MREVTEHLNSYRKAVALMQADAAFFSVRLKRQGRLQQQGGDGCVSER